MSGPRPTNQKFKDSEVMRIARAATYGLLVPALLAMRPVADELTFSPEEGSSLSKTFEMSLSLALDDAMMLVDGNDMAEVLLAQEPSVDATFTWSIEDTYEEMGDGRPTKLLRTFTEAGMEYDTGDDSGSESMEDLEGKSIRFTWDDEEDGYIAEFADEEEGDEDLLNGLGEDMDLRALLPGEGVSIGDTWEVDLINDVLMPGMDLTSAMDSSEIPPEAEPLIAFIEGEIENLIESMTLSCEYMGSRDEDGVQVGVVGLSLECTYSVSLVDLIADMVSMAPVEIEMETEYADIEFELAGEGELLWDLAGGHVSSFGLESDMACFIDAAMSADVGGQMSEQEASIELSGSMAWSATAE